MSDLLQTEQHAAESRVTRRARRRGANKMTAMLGPDRSITLVGSDLTFAGVIALLEDLLSRAKRAKAQQITLPTFIRILADQNGSASGE